MFKKKFYFIVFEGIEGTGKSYQIDKLYKNLKKKKYPVIKTREPGGSKTAEIIRNLIFNKNSNNFDDKTDFYLMLAARNEHYINKILPAIKNKNIVICDRFTDSTLIYQVFGKKINKKVNLINQKFILKRFKPNLTIILKSDLKKIIKRIKVRKNNNKFDKLKLSFFKKAQNSYVSLSKKNRRDYLIFDSSLDNNQLEKEILLNVVKRIGN